MRVILCFSVIVILDLLPASTLAQPVRDRPVEPLKLGPGVEKVDLPVPSAYKGGAMVRLGGAPASVIRLASGRLALAWNPRSEVPKTASDWALQGRWELAVALSDDEGKTWTKPLVCARAASVTNPHLLESPPADYC